jgi:hypothetical protein
MRFNQFLIAPYIGDGSPIDQTMWVDEMTVADARPASGVMSFDDKTTPALALNVNSIDFTLHKASEISLVAVDALGRSTKLYRGSFPEGAISMPYSRELLPSGVYHLLLRDNFSTLASAKVMIVK